jgi:predicted DNA-binding transcriptional regulator AlpA
VSTKKKKAATQPAWLRPASLNHPLAVESPLLPPQGEPRLLDRHKTCELADATYSTLWAWMRAGKFPRSRIVGGRSMWLSTEVFAWMASLPVRRLKGDAS